MQPYEARPCSHAAIRGSSTQPCSHTRLVQDHEPYEARPHWLRPCSHARLVHAASSMPARPCATSSMRPRRRPRPCALVVVHAPLSMSSRPSSRRPLRPLPPLPPLPPLLLSVLSVLPVLSVPSSLSSLASLVPRLSRPSPLQPSRVCLPVPGRRRCGRRAPPPCPRPPAAPRPTPAEP